MLPRKTVLLEELDEPKLIKTMTHGQYPAVQFVQEDVPEEEKNLITSELIGEYETSPIPMHAPTLDIDIPMTVYESSTPGHHHLFFDVAMPWWKYRFFLYVLAWVGIIEKGYYEASVQRGATFLRKRSVLKPEAIKEREEKIKAAQLTWQ